MKFRSLIFLFLVPHQFILFSQGTIDSLVLYSDLKFHSEFEKTAIQNYILHKKDTFNLFVAIDADMTVEMANTYHRTYLSILNDLHRKKIKKKKINKKIKQAFTIVHDQYLQKYNEIEYLPILFQSGTYNCVSSSILYSMIFDELEIPYKIQVTTNHVYLVANPGPNSVVVETTNPKLQGAEYLEGFKKQYISHLKSLKVVSDQEFKNKSLDELFEEKMNKVNQAEFDNLAGFQYYNKGLIKYTENKPKEAYELLQKAYFFYPSKQVRSVMYPVLLSLIEKCSYSKVNNIDYIAQLARYDEITTEMIIGILIEILKYHLQFTDRQAFCDSIYKRFIPQIKDNNKREELSFNFYLFMSRHYKNTDKQQQYIENALLIRQNHQEANELFKSYISQKLDKKVDYMELLESIKELREKYRYDFIVTLLSEYELMAHLNKAYDFFKYNHIVEGEKYLRIFEKISKQPVESKNKKFIRTIENTYRTLAVYYFYRNNKSKAIETVERGLRYVPRSRYIQTAVY